MRRSNYTATSVPSALGDPPVESACTKINQLCQRTMSVMTEYPHDLDDTVRMLFDPSVLDRACAAKELIEPESHTIPYEIGSPIELSGMLYLNYKAAATNFPPINAEASNLQGHCTPLLEFVSKVRGIHLQFEEIKGVLRWLNRSATAGAIRYYFPAVLSLCPDSPPVRDLQHVPSRYHQPKNIHQWTDAIKDALAVYAGTQMLPASALYRGRDRGMWLTIPSCRVIRGDMEYSTDAITYNL